MKSCPSCQRNHDDHFDVCLDCGTSLTPRPLWVKFLLGLVFLGFGAGLFLLAWRAFSPLPFPWQTVSPPQATTEEMPPSTSNPEVAVVGQGRPSETAPTYESVQAAPKLLTPTAMPARTKMDVVSAERLGVTNPSPVPRPRLQRTSVGTSVVVDPVITDSDPIHTTEAQFMALVEREVFSEYQGLTAKLGDDPAILSHCTVTVRVNLGTGSMEVLGTEGDISERRRACLSAAVSKTSGNVRVPASLRDGPNQFFDIRIGVKVVPRNR